MKLALVTVLILLGSSNRAFSNDVSALRTIPFEWTQWSKCDSEGIKFRERMQTIRETAYSREGCCDGTESTKFKDCSEIFKSGKTKPGNYYIWIDQETKVEVACMADGWTVIQSRGQFGNPKDYFYRNWDSYVKGFGVPGKEHWLGLNNIHDLTQARAYELRVTLRKFDKVVRYALYKEFYLKDRTLYKLHTAGYTGNAGDGLTYHQGRPFATYDHEPNAASAKKWQGAWWYNGGHHSNLNSLNFGTDDKTPYAQAIGWSPFTGHYQQARSVEMAIRPSGWQ